MRRFPRPTPPRHHSHTMPPTYMETIGFYRDAARHVATNAGEPARGARRALGSGQATLGLPLLHRPYRECGSQTRELIECDSLRQAAIKDVAIFITTGTKNMG